MNGRADPRGLILWILLAAGILLLYSGVKGYTPQSILTSFLNRSQSPVPFSHSANGTGDQTPVYPSAPPGYRGGTVFPGGVSYLSPNSAAPKSAIKVVNV